MLEWGQHSTHNVRLLPCDRNLGLGGSFPEGLLVLSYDSRVAAAAVQLGAREAARWQVRVDLVLQRLSFFVLLS
jgi:hypothetical protein